MLKTLLELRRWLAWLNFHPEDQDRIHVTVTFPDKDTRSKAEAALVRSFEGDFMPESPMRTSALGTSTYRLVGVDLSLASSCQEDTPHLQNARTRISELERENNDLRSRLDCALLELESRLTYR